MSTAHPTSSFIETYKIIAAMYNAPYILCAHDMHTPLTLPQGYEKLRAVVCEVGGDTAYHMLHEREWSKFSNYLSPLLRENFAELAAEPMPDREYWCKPKNGTLDPDKLQRLHTWLQEMDLKYSKVQEVPGLHSVAAGAVAAEAAQAEQYKSFLEKRGQEQYQRLANREKAAAKKAAVTEETPLQQKTVRMTKRLRTQSGNSDALWQGFVQQDRKESVEPAPGRMARI